jgi:hypothetical protein
MHYNRQNEFNIKSPAVGEDEERTENGKSEHAISYNVEFQDDIKKRRPRSTGILSQ